MVKTYKRSLFVMIKGIVIAPCTAMVVYLIMRFFVANRLVLVGVPLLLFAILLFMALFSENIKFEIDSKGKLTYYKMGKCVHSFHLPDCSVGYRRSSETSFPPSHDIQMDICNLQDGSEETIDCSPLGLGRFEEMYAEIGRYSADEPEVLSAGKKRDEDDDEEEA